MGTTLDRRRAETDGRFRAFKAELLAAENHCAGKACVYVTGSFGRGEASEHSDLDLFIVGQGEKDNRLLSRLDEICLKADLIQATRKLRLSEFSGDGEYLTHYTASELVDRLGKPEDDALNTFTARLLMILESKPLIGQPEYWQAIDRILAAYWRDYEDHKDSFTPAYLANDILRMWRTFCVNYEARTATEPPDKKAKRKLKNYKLKHSRLLTCYSALLYLLEIFGHQETVRPDQAKEMIRLTPTERLESLRTRTSLGSRVDDVLRHYEGFLDTTGQPEKQLINEFRDPNFARERFHDANTFGELIFRLVSDLGSSNRLHRLLVV